MAETELVIRTCCIRGASGTSERKCSWDVKRAGTQGEVEGKGCGTGNHPDFRGSWSHGQEILGTSSRDLSGVSRTEGRKGGVDWKLKFEGR